MKIRIAKRYLYARYRQAIAGMAFPFPITDEVRAWLDVIPVGREFGSPDSECQLSISALTGHVTARSGSDEALKR